MIVMKKMEFDILEKIIEILDLYVNENDHYIYESGGMPYIFPDKEQFKKIKFLLSPNDIVKIDDQSEIFFNPLRIGKLSKFIMDDFISKNDIDEFDVTPINNSLSGKFIKDRKIIYELTGVAPLSALIVAIIIAYSEEGDEDYYDIKKKLERIMYSGTNGRPEKSNKKSKALV
jgi:hypothetical protein